jgi:hypothetical protein
MSTFVRLQDGTYAEIHARFGLPAQLACSVPRRMGATDKTLWTTVRAHAKGVRRG